MAFSGFQDFNPDFSRQLQMLIARRPGISVFSGYRSPEHQAELFQAAIAKYGSPEAARRWVAPPPGAYGSHGSQHNFGRAADLHFATDADRQWAHEHAGELGLNFRLGNEPWHIELAGGGSGGGSGGGGGGGGLGGQGQYDVPMPAADPYEPVIRRRRDTSDPTVSAFQADKQQADILSLAALLRPQQSQKSIELLKKIRGYPSGQTDSIPSFS